MIKRIVKKAVLLGVIPKDEEEVYAFSYQTLGVEIAVWAAVVLVGAMFQRLLGSFFFILFFKPLRSYAGGSHLASPKLCFVASLATIMAIVGTSWLPIEQVPRWVFLGISLTCAVCVFGFSPQDDKNRPATRNEMLHFRKMSRIIVSIELVILCIGISSGLSSRLIYFMVAGTALAAVLVTIRALRRYSERMH